MPCVVLPMRLVVLLMLLAVATATVPSWGVVSAAYKLRLDDANPPQRAAELNLAGRRGECEHAQVYVRSNTTELTNVTLTFTGMEDSVSFSYKQVMYVNCSKSTHYSPSGGGYFPDPLLEVGPEGMPRVEVASSQPLFVSACISPDASPGNFTGTATLAGTGAGTPFTVSIPIKVEVWSLSPLPAVNDTSSISTIFTFNEDLQKWFPSWASGSAIQNETYAMLTDHRIPGDDLYIGAPRPVEEYVALAESGAKLMNLMDVSGGIRNNSFPASYVQHVLTVLTPVVKALEARGLLDKAYVYGFDEMPSQFNSSVYQLFGAVKKAFPGLKTAAALDWQSMPADLPVDIWIDEYDQWTPERAIERQHWVGSGHEFFWYWCIAPSQAGWLNTFVERPAIQARLLFWLAALHQISGWLYYEVNIWASQCPSMRSCDPVSRINGTAKTAFNPATWNSHNPTLAGGANGDGSFTYPGPDGLLSSLRLEQIRDGLEDMELFRLLGGNSTWSSASDLITQVVSNGTVFVEDPGMMEHLRREAAHRAMVLGL